MGAAHYQYFLAFTPNPAVLTHLSAFVDLTPPEIRQAFPNQDSESCDRPLFFVVVLLVVHIIRSTAVVMLYEVIM